MVRCLTVSSELTTQVRPHASKCRHQDGPTCQELQKGRSSRPLRIGRKIPECPSFNARSGIVALMMHSVIWGQASTSCLRYYLRNYATLLCHLLLPRYTLRTQPSATPR